MAGDSAKVILDNLHLASERISSFKQVAVDQTSQEIRKFNLKSYIEDILTSIQPAYKKTKHKVILTGDDSLDVISAPGALSQVFTNLVMNSLKHGFEGIEQGTVTIDVHRGENGVEIVFNATRSSSFSGLNLRRISCIPGDSNWNTATESPRWNSSNAFGSDSLTLSV